MRETYEKAVTFISKQSLLGDEFQWFMQGFSAEWAQTKNNLDNNTGIYNSDSKTCSDKI